MIRGIFGTLFKICVYLNVLNILTEVKIVKRNEFASTCCPLGNSINKQIIGLFALFEAVLRSNRDCTQKPRCDIAAITIHKQFSSLKTLFINLKSFASGR